MRVGRHDAAPATSGGRVGCRNDDGHGFHPAVRFRGQVCITALLLISSFEVTGTTLGHGIGASRASNAAII
jgi:hypothetical protein